MTRSDSVYHSAWEVGNEDGWLSYFDHGILAVNDDFGCVNLTPDEAVNLASALLQWASSVRSGPHTHESSLVEGPEPAQEESEDA